MKQETKDKMVDTMQKKDKLGLTICWRCANAGKVGCEWFKNDKPVPGWEAEKVPYIMTYTSNTFYKKVETETYIVRYCPKFTEMEERQASVYLYQKES